MTPHYNHLDETVLMMGHKICFNEEIWIVIPKLSLLLLLIWSTAYNYLKYSCSASASSKGLDQTVP